MQDHVDPADLRTQPGRDEPLLQLAGEGLHGTTRDAQTGLPLAASVWINGNPICSYSDPLDGGFHRVVPPGTYNLTVWAPGYVPRTVPNVVVASGAPGNFQALLESGGGDYAFRVVSVAQRDPNHVHANTTFPSRALRIPDGAACSLGSAGFIVLDMGEGHEIIDRSGADFRVVEALTPNDPLPEAYNVHAGSAYLQNVLIGSGVGTAEFDLAASGLSSARYVKILDASGAPPNGPYAGMELDALTGNINVSSAPALPPEAMAVTEVRLVAAPNPFRSSTALLFTLSRSAPVELTNFDAGGRRVAPPMNLAPLAPGRHELRVDCSAWSAGAYFCRIRTEGTSSTERIVRVR